MKKRSLAILLVLALVFMLAGCGSKSESASSYNGAYMSTSDSAAYSPAEAPDGYWNEEAELAQNMSGGSENRSTLPEGIKMIYRASLELESTEFSKASDDIATLVEQLGGYFENRSVRDYSSGYHYATYTVRVPSEKFQSFLNQIGDLCHVTYKTDSAENITERYYDTESRLRTAQIKLERLQALLEKAENMEDIITIESAISDTEYEIESFSGELRHYDALVGFATIEISLKEVQKLTEVETTPPTFGQRLGSAFRDGLSDFGDAVEDFLEWLAYSWLTLLVIAAVIVVIVKLIKRGKAKRAAAGVPDSTSRKKLFGKKKKDASAEETGDDKQ